MKVLKVNYKSFFPVLAILLFCGPLPSQAQIWKNLGRKVEQKIEQQASRRAEKKIDQAINKGFDKVEGAADDAVSGSGKDASKDTSKDASAKKSGNTGLSALLSGAGKAVELKSVYEFGTGVTYAMKDSPKSKPMNMTMWIGKEDYIGMATDASEDMFMILHDANIITFMLKEGKYMAMGSGMTEQILAAAAEEAEEDEISADFTMKKVGTERILNYLCDIYEIKTEDTTTKIWVTQEFGINGQNFMSSFGALVKNTGKMPDLGDQAGGLLMKMEAKDTKGKDTMSMEAVSIYRDGISFNTSDYAPFGF